MKNRIVIVVSLLVLNIVIYFCLYSMDKIDISNIAKIRDYPAEMQHNTAEMQDSAADIKDSTEVIQGSTAGFHNRTENTQDDTAEMQDGATASAGSDEYYINEAGTYVEERILLPEGFERIGLDEGSFGEYLRKLPLKPHGSRVVYYNGNIKPADVHEAVIDIDVGARDLQQCADSVIRLRAEYLYSKGLYDEIHFNFTNGFKADYSTWMKGNRIRVDGNNAYWVKQGSASNDYASFRKYLDIVFAYAGTLSLSKEMISVPVEEMQPGDVFIYGQTPGHCIIVLDMAKNSATGEKIFILAQGYMPAQEMHILKNPANQDGNPWYTLSFGENLRTPEWQFKKEQLMRFR